ncbi:MAG TPA: M6 family metalloprotease domain-containing protein, partial [Chitinispirillaceae bacterium]|nr:M6 family metalloprotease domain-containing protein [Chitinispirillaceae bacterium]
LSGIQQHLRNDPQTIRISREQKIAELNAYETVQDKKSPGLGKTTALADTVRGITVLIDFPDQKTEIPYDSINAFVNATGYKANRNNGSVKEYFYDVSNGKLTYINLVSQFVTAKNNKSYYDRTDGSGYAGAYELINEILTTMKNAGSFDFSKATYSGTTTKTLTAVNFLYAGSPSAGWAQGLWPHSGSTRFSINGVNVSSYQMSSIGRALTIGTFVHENGHMLCKWKDLYAYDESSKGAGGYDVMCVNGSTNPVPPNAFYRSLMGWITLKEISKDPLGTAYKLPADLNNALVYTGTSATSAQEMFVVEARRRTGRNATLPDSGLIIWHIDKAGSNTEAGKNDYVVPEQADGKNDLELKVNNGNIGDLFRANNVAKFNDSTKPNANFHNGSKSGLQVANVSAVKDTMTFSLGALTTSVMAHTVLKSNMLAYDAHTGRITFGITQGQFKIALYNVNGRQVLQIVNRDCKENNLYAIDLKKELGALNGTSAAGKYICQLSVSGTVLSSLSVMIP